MMASKFQFFNRFIDHILQIIPNEETYTYKRHLDYSYYPLGFISLLYNALKQLRRFGFDFSKGQKQHKKIVFYVETLNQYNALLPLMRHYEYESVVYKHPQLSIQDKSYNIPLTKLYFLALLIYPCTIFFSFRLTSKYSGKLNKSHVLVYAALGIAALQWSKKLIQKVRPKTIIVSNDHLFLPVALIFASKGTSTKSVYLQHASIMPIFPPLTVDIALLDGSEAQRIYSLKGINETRVMLSGMIKSDGYIRLKPTPTSIAFIGICLNILDDIVEIEHLIKHINSKYPNLLLEVRSHPAMASSPVFQNSQRLKLSEPKNEKIFEFLKRVDLLIAGESSVHIEAAIVNIPSFYFNSWHKPLDNYGFIKSGLVSGYFENIRGFDDCMKNLTLNQDFVIRAKPYCDTINSEYENRSLDLALKIIDDTLT
jgi:hypothetical protein